jgi:hypothetical protein
MIDLVELEEMREKAGIDKVDLFDFYNKHWNKVTNHVEELENLLEEVTKWMVEASAPDYNGPRRDELLAKYRGLVKKYE